MTPAWSVSRDSTLEACERRYYYQYIVTARSNSRNDLLRQIAYLKHVRSIAVWAGDIFHSAAADLVRTLARRRLADIDSVIAQARTRMHAEWDFSAAGTYKSNVKALADGHGVALFEHEYELAIPDDAKEQSLDRVSEWIERFAAWTRECDLTATLRRAKQVWIEPKTFGPQAPGFRMDGAQVITKVDLAIQSLEGEFRIFDWKTGAVPADAVYRTPDSEYQVTVYQLWPHLSLAVPLNAITATVVWVSRSPAFEQHFAIDENTRERAMRRLRSAIARARYLEGGAGAPLFVEDDFDLAAHLGICRWCRFKRVCQGSVSGLRLTPDDGVLEFDFGGTDQSKTNGISAAGLFA